MQTKHQCGRLLRWDRPQRAADEVGVSIEWRALVTLPARELKECEATPPAEVVDRQVRRDPVEPRAQLRLGRHPSRARGPLEGLVHQVLRGRRISRQPPQVTEERRSVERVDALPVHRPLARCCLCGDPGPFSWLFPTAEAGGTPSTVPMSPDGLLLYAAGKDGITVLRIPDLEPVAKLAVGMSINEVWISGDGRTVYATDEGRGLVVIGPDGSPIRVELNDTAGFIASERG
ncbi:MAG: hypothetical protein A3G84_03015 [Chloroflexi bacterium RIFCSPLOWO2_12_FULL_71_12]|nr:MAG: hypothetical protein A3G84_03015 [Chloroflexi bacterium RIFCSPLOWO2_12_FULL_71_12]